MVQVSLKMLLRIANFMQRRLDDFFETPQPKAEPAPEPAPVQRGGYTVDEISTLLELLAQLKPALQGASGKIQKQQEG